MTSCRDIVTTAMQKAGLLAIGETPTADEGAAGLDELQAMYDDLVFTGQFGELTDVYKTEDYTAKEFERIFANDATITLPDTIDEGGDIRKPKDLSVIVINETTWRMFVWDGSWVEMSNLTLDTDAPLATRNKQGLACYLATLFVDAFGGEVSLTTMQRGYRFKQMIMGGGATATPDVEYF